MATRLLLALLLAASARAAGPVRLPEELERPASASVTGPAAAVTPDAALGGLPEAAAPALEAPAGAAPAAPEAEAAGSGVRGQDVPPSSLDALFDGRRRAGRGGSTLAEAGRIQELRTLSLPWRTRAQVAKLQATPARETTRFSVIGDSEPGELWFIRLLNPKGRGMYEKLLRRASEQLGEFTVQIGDMVSRGTVSNFLDFFRKLHAVAPPQVYLTVPGNHDRSTPRARRTGNDDLYRWLFGYSDHYFDRAGTRLVFLNNSGRRLSADQLRWLDETLATGPDIRAKIVFAHVPPSGLTEWGDVGRFKHVGSFKEGADDFMRIMAEREVDRVYLGHVHAFGVIERDGVRYVLTGGGGSPLFALNVKDRFHHFIEVESGPDGIRELVHRADGKTFPLPPTPPKRDRKS